MKTAAECAAQTGKDEKRPDGVSRIKELIRRSGLNQQGIPRKVIGRTCNLVCPQGKLVPDSKGVVIGIEAPCSDTLNLFVSDFHQNGKRIESLTFKTGVWSMVRHSDVDHATPETVAGIRLLRKAYRPRRRSKYGNNAGKNSL